ncbi:tudor and KH domain-containing protein-like [Lytechinus pictus]|uniref:tudor and KH domain-containing protein-like n=1 Tax=Lytechinus pictus TaxID=7653 RepID=UPI0030B9B797
MMSELSSRQKVALAIALPASMVLIYLLFKKRDDYDVPAPSKHVATIQRQTIDMNIPHNKVGPLIGREGTNIKRIQAESGAQIKFSDETKRDDTADRHLCIHGNRDSILLAERLINEFLAEQPEIITKTLMLPQQAVGRIIGRQGTNIRRIQNSSMARVKIDRDVVEGIDTLRRCTIRGTLTQVDTAEYMIRQEINEMEDYNQRLADAAANRKERPTGKSSNKSVQPKPVLTVDTAPKPEEWHVDTTSTAQLPKNKDFFTVYVSAVEHPGHFWLQIVSSKAKDLDLMLMNMTEFYNNPDNQKAFQPDSLQKGEIVAAPFSHDQMWYRTRILGFLDGDMVDLYYVDYGDSEAVPKSSVCTLRDDFLILPFQAVEFSLANVFPSGGDEWTEEAIEYFEQLTHVAKWKPLQAKIIDYQNTDIGTIPCIELYDTADSFDINIGKQLRLYGFAKSRRDKEREMTKEMTSPEASSALPSASVRSEGDGAHDTENYASL